MQSSPQQERPTKKPKINPKVEDCEIMGNYVGKLPLVIQLLKTINQSNTQLDPAIKTPTKLIMYGDSGNGKSTLILSLAKEINCNLIHLDGYEFMKQWEALTPSPDISEHLKTKFIDCLQPQFRSEHCIFWLNGGFDKFFDKLKHPETVLKTIEAIRALTTNKKSLFIAEQHSEPNQFLKTNFDTIRLGFPDFNARYSLFKFFAQKVLSSPVLLQNKHWENLAHKSNKLVGSEIRRIVDYTAINICTSRTTPTLENNKELAQQEECFMEVLESQCKELLTKEDYQEKKRLEELHHHFT